MRCGIAIRIPAWMLAVTVITSSPLAHAQEEERDERGDPIAPTQATLSESELEQALRRLSATDPRARAEAADLLGRRAYDRVPRVSEPLRRLASEDDDWRVQASAIRALGRLEVRRALPVLVRALRHERPEIRVTAAAALWRIPDPVVVPALIARLDDESAAVRQWAATALGSPRDRRAVGPLVDLLGDPEPNVRAEAIRSLRRIGGDGALGELKRHAMDPDQSFDEQKEALAAVLELTEDDVAVLVELARSPDPVFRRHVIRGIGALGNASVAADLRALLRRERDWRTRRELLSAIRQVSARETTSN